MNAKQFATLLLAATTLSASLAPGVAQAHDDDVVIGALIGGIAGAAIGSNMGGRNSALVGAAIGSVTGAAIGSSNRHPGPPPVAYRAPVVQAAAYPPPAPVVYVAQPVSYPQVVAYEDKHEWREHRHEWREHRAWREGRERGEYDRGHDRGFTYPPSGY